MLNPVRLFVFAFVALPFAALAQSTAAAPAKSAACHAITIAPSPAQLAYEQGEFKAAADKFVSERASSQGDERLHAQEIRNLLAKGDVAEATKQADAFAAASPGSAYARNAVAEALFRNGKLPEAYAAAANAQKLDPCNARAYETLFQYETVSALHATAKRHIDLAHALAPNDADITMEWISTLPTAQRIAALRKFAETSPSLTDKQRARAKARIDSAEKHMGEAQCKLTSPTQEATVPFSAIRYTADSEPAYGVEISFNGKKRRLELDTGASGLLLTAAAAQRLGLTIEEEAYVGGIGDEGSKHSGVAHVSKLQIGSLEFSNCAVYILKSANFSRQSGTPFEDIDGLVGGDIFRQFLLTLDYPGGGIRLAPLPPRPGEQPTEASLSTTEAGKSIASAAESNGVQLDRYRSPDMQDWTSFYRIFHYILVPTQLDAGPVKLLMADTGAGLNVISTDAAREVTKVATTNQFSLYGLSGETKRTYLTQRIVLHFANLYLPLEWMVAADTKDLSSDAGTEISGFLGFPALKQMTVQIDYRDNLIHFVFDPKRKVNSRFIH